MVHDLQKAIAEKVQLKPGTSVAFSGRIRAAGARANLLAETDGADDADDHLRAVVSGVPSGGRSVADYQQRTVALVGGIWLLWWMGFHLSVAVGTGVLLPAGRAEFGVVMLMYLRHMTEPSLNNPQTFSEQKLDEALYHDTCCCACAQKAMTLAVIIAGLLPFCGEQEQGQR